MKWKKKNRFLVKVTKKETTIVFQLMMSFNIDIKSRSTYKEADIY